MRRWLWILLLVGCGKTHDEPPPPLPAPEPGELDLDPPFRSGARLRAEVIADAAGTRAFSKWFDSELDLPCQFLRSGDGEERCLPSTSWIADAEPRVSFADAQCTREMVHVTDGARFWVGYPLPGEPCEEARFPVRNVGELVPSDSVEYGIDAATGVCTELPFLPNLLPGERHFLEDEVPPEWFQRGERAVAGGSQRLRPIEVHGDDGSFERIGIRDAELELDCQPRAGVCLPLQAAFVAMPYVDEACTEHVVNYAVPSAFRTADCLPPQLAYRMVADGCGSRIVVHALGERYLGALFTNPTNAAGQCGFYEDASDEPRSFRLGPELGQSLEPVSNLWLGQGRLRVLAQLAPDGARVDEARSPLVMDAAVRAGCSAQELCDGTLVCEPTEVYPLFADTRCSRAIYASSSDSCAEPPAAIPALRGGGCWDGSFLELGPSVEVETLYGNGFGECRAVSLGVSEPRLQSTRPSSQRPLELTRRIE